jgi:replicative DNA helicase
MEINDYFIEHGDTLVIPSVQTGFYDLDRIIGGLGKTNMVILAARPSMGKTAFAMNIAENIAINQKIPVGIFSLEMSAEQLVYRLISSNSGIPAEKIKNGNITPYEYQDILSSVKKFESCEIVIDDASSGSLGTAQLVSRARRMKEVYGVQCVIVDYIQLIKGRTNAESRQVEVSEISRSMKSMAKELDIAILCLAQLSRKVEERSIQVPMLSDLRESGSLEQDADSVLFLYRPDKGKLPEKDKTEMALLKVAKNRHGPDGDVALTFMRETASFKSYIPIKYDMGSL